MQINEQIQENANPPRNSSAKRAFGRWLTNYNWSNLYHTTLCEQHLELFQEVISTGLNHFLPRKVVKIHDRDEPWINPSYKQLIKHKQKAFFQKDDKLYYQLRIRAFREGKTLKSTFLRIKLEHLKQNPNPKKWWDTMKHIAGFPKKKSFSSLIIEDYKLFLENNSLIKSTTLSYPLLVNSPLLLIFPPLITNRNATTALFQSSSSLRKKKCIPGYLQYHLQGLLV